MFRISQMLMVMVAPFFLVCSAKGSELVLPWGGEWPFPLVVETINTSDISGHWTVEERGLVLEIESSQENDKLISIVGRSTRNRKWVSIGIASLEEGFFHGWIRHNQGNDFEIHEIMIGRGRNRPTGKDFFYLIERVGGDRPFRVDQLRRVER